MTAVPERLRAQQAAFQQAIVLQQDDLAPAWRIADQRPSLLRVYQFAYGARLAGALRDNFDVLPQVMGDEAFDALAAAYISAHPSQHPSIRWYGHRLVEFMTQREDLVPHAALIDVARMEWALRAAFDAADATPLTPAVLGEVPAESWPDLVLTLHPSVQVVPMAWAIEPVWQALGGHHEEAGQPPELPEPQAQPHTLVVWRVGLDTRWRSMATSDTALLKAVQAEDTFADLCVLAAQTGDEAQAAVAVVTALQAWLADGWLSAWHLAPPTLSAP